MSYIQDYSNYVYNPTPTPITNNNATVGTRPPAPIVGSGGNGIIGANGANLTQFL